MRKCFNFIKKETILCAAILLAAISSCFVLPDKKYFSYIDVRTLAILFCLMAVVSGFQKIGVFRMIAQALLKKVYGGCQMVMILVFLCFFFSMLITNDVALITFVPFGIQVLGMMGKEIKMKMMIPVVVLQTIAANLGSMLTPIGNPQNLYLYAESGIKGMDFILLMFPYSIVSFVIILICCWYVGRNLKQGKIPLKQEKIHLNKREFIAWTILFLLCLLAVADVISYEIVFLIVAAGVFVIDRKIFSKIDYALLGTFAAFFIFIGNVGRMPEFCKALESVIEGNEVITAVAASQVISNVPAALLLSGFTDNIQSLIIGTNLGGLGTLIASMASLISFRYIGAEDKKKRLPYLGYFTVANVLFLIIILNVSQHFFLVFYKVM